MGTVNTPLHPTVLWAQRKNRLLLTIDLQGCKDPQIKVENDEASKKGKILFKGHAHSHGTGPEEHTYEFELVLCGEVDPEDVKQATTERFVYLVVAKKEEGPHWPRLLAEKGKPAPFIKVDWDKWVDEDEEDGAGGDGDFPGGFDFSQLANMGGGMGGGMPDFSAMGGMGGFGGEGGDDSDDDEDGGMPGLEAAAPPAAA